MWSCSDDLDATLGAAGLPIAAATGSLPPCRVLETAIGKALPGPDIDVPALGYLVACGIIPVQRAQSILKTAASGGWKPALVVMEALEKVAGGRGVGTALE